MSARDRILERVREALSDRETAAHPGAFEGWRPTTASHPVDGLVQLLEAAGGEVVRAGATRKVAGCEYSGTRGAAVHVAGNAFSTRRTQ